MNIYPLFASTLIESVFGDEESIKKLNQICEDVEWSTNKLRVVMVVVLLKINLF